MLGRKLHHIDGFHARHMRLKWKHGERTPAGQKSRLARNCSEPKADARGSEPQVQ